MLNDARFQRMAKEYEALRGAQDHIMGGLEQVLPMIISKIEENGQRIEENGQHIHNLHQLVVNQVGRDVAANRDAIVELHHMVQAIMAEMNIEIKPSMGFNTAKGE